jgi:FlaA1/EpsC-like NDP-sugar epimerase
VLCQLKLVLEGAQNAAVKKVVVLSTKKAFQQSSPYRHSKALAESIFFAPANTEHTVLLFRLHGTYQLHIGSAPIAV